MLLIILSTAIISDSMTTKCLHWTKQLIMYKNNFLAMEK